MAGCLEPNLDSELIVIACGGEVANDHGERIKVKRAEIIDASPDAVGLPAFGALANAGRAQTRPTTAEPI
jgi:hypothetical protein